MNKPHERAAHEYSTRPTHQLGRSGRGSFEDALTVAAYVILAAIFGAGLLLGLLVGAWLW